MAFNAEFLPVELNGQTYAVDTTMYRRTTVPVSRQQRDNSKEPGENTLDTTGAWVRSQTDWSYGAGQLYLDNEDSDRRRFYSSQGIDIWTKGQITLLNDTEDTASSLTLTTEDPIIQRFVSSSSEYIYLVSDSTIYYSASNGSSWATLSGSNNITDISSDGTYVYIAQTGANVPRKYTLGDNTTDHGFGTLTPDLLQIVGGRVIGAKDNEIFELDSAGAKASSSLDYSLPLTTSKWVSATAASNGIYAAANTDNTGSVYYIGVNSSDGTLNAPTLAASLPRNETINEIIAYSGLLGLATSAGFRLALISQESSGLTIGPAIDTGGEVFSLEADGKFMWFGCDNAQVYRADLSLFTETLVPAYASDLKMSGSVSASDKVVSLVRLSNSGDPKLFLAVNKGSGAGVLYREHYSGNKVATGELIAGEITWSTVVPKLLRSGVIDLDRSQYERAKTAYRTTTAYTASTTYSLGSETTTPVGKIRLTATNGALTSSTIPSSSGTLTTGNPETFSFSDGINTAISYDLKVELERSASPVTSAPICHDWQLTAVAVPRRIDEVILPIVFRRDVTTSRGSGKPRAALIVKDAFENLRALMESGTAISYKEGKRTDNVTIERLEMTPERLSDDGGWWEGTLMVRLLTVPS
tara:strand:+ start:213 stop:2135 length:1923 start_codon:yes stop_codon:yes gene_type:complete